VPPPIKPPKPAAGALAGVPPPAMDALSRAAAQKDVIVVECGELETELEELKVKYEMYFLGVDKREPIRAREDLKKRVLRLKEAFTRNAALRFRLQSLHARFLSYERMWLRSAREKEEGTYHRDVFKAKMHIEARVRKERIAREEAEAAAPRAAEQKAPTKAPAAKAPAVAKADPTQDLLAAWGMKPPAGAPAKTPPTGKTPAAAAKPSGQAVTPPRPTPADPADRQMRELYTQYIDAKKKCGEDVSRLTYDAVAKSVQKQVPEIMTRFKAKSVEFKVVVKDGKATLKAVPKA
jgi:cell wall-associated NlpC family hydrolase